MKTAFLQHTKQHSRDGSFYMACASRHSDQLVARNAHRISKSPAWCICWNHSASNISGHVPREFNQR
jgi:hypothetical protein